MTRLSTLFFVTVAFTGSVGIMACGSSGNTDSKEPVEATSQALITNWNGCRGQGNYVCSELAGDTYFTNHPGCVKNPTCAGKFYACSATCPEPTPAEEASDVIMMPTGTNTRINQGDRLYSPNGAYYMTFQTDSNLVGYRASDGRAMWDTGTEGSGANTLVYQTDGNLVMYGTVCRDVRGRVCNPRFQDTCACASVPLWDTGTNGAPAGSYLMMQNDDNLVIYSPTHAVEWSSR